MDRQQEPGQRGLDWGRVDRRRRFDRRRVNGSWGRINGSGISWRSWVDRCRVSRRGSRINGSRISWGRIDGVCRGISWRRGIYSYISRGGGISGDIGIGCSRTASGVVSVGAVTGAEAVGVVC